MQTTLILSTLGTMYLWDRCRHDICVQLPQKPPINKFQLIMLRIPIKLQEQTLLLSTQGTKYFGDHCRCDIRVQ
ncbi:hypothetical protein TSAR_015529 [Trichomalopsis sarcophagae]|uniref:Uncharacterized protein n=1 Tax=Trichomalopsis sarcophagae TaxID=543379 RepID=A0A232EIJ7_9HYME|nr:hypothetical protein TSAR_015529 [Trichomalopsis sarcophagae]